MLLGAVAILTIFGITMINSAQAGNIELVEANIVQRQIIFSLVGFVVIMIVSAIDYHLFESMSQTMYIITFVLLAVLDLVGAALFGSARWLDIGFFLVQPSELAKIVMILVLASTFSRNQQRVNEPTFILRSLVMTLGVVIWILLQPDLSTSIVIMVIWFALIWVSGLRVRFLVYSGAAALVLVGTLLPLLLNPEFVNDESLIKPYQVQRITNFLFPDPEASYGEQYNVNQALISIGSGGVLGKGYGQGSQVQLRFLKVRHTDFIFSATAEEFGFAGIIALLGLLFFVIFRCLRAARQARDTFGGLIAYGVATMIAFHTLVNIGMNLKLIPVTGLPLPFVSYGGSALLTMLLGIGLVQSVVLRHKSLEF